MSFDTLVWRALLGAALLAAVFAAVPPPARADLTAIQEVPEGTILGKDNWEMAKGLLPDEILQLYRDGDYAHPIRKLQGKKGKIVDPRLVEYAQKNAKRFTINDDGTVVDKETGKRPPVITGWPFPEIDADDPKAGYQVLWNYIYTLQWAGSFHTVSPLNWVDRSRGILRRIALDTHFKYYDGQPPEIQETLGENPLGILSRTMAVVKEPSDLEGLVALNWRYREGEQSDQAWTYVPALRRVRSINPANRADGFLGSDLSQDDGPYFDGKPEDFKVKLVGEGWILGTFDNPGLDKVTMPVKLDEDMEVSDLIDSSETGWRVSYPDLQLIASQAEDWDPNEDQVSWSPSQIALLPRPVWIIEAEPKNPYYIYGKQIMYIDKENFRGYWKSKFDWKGNVIANYAPPESLIHEIPGPPGHMRLGYSGGVAIVNNFKQDRATVSGLPVADTEWWVQMDDELFETSRIIRQGK